MENKINWDDFQNWFFELQAGSKGQDKDYFLNLATKCGNAKMTDELAAWYENGNYRK